MRNVWRLMLTLFLCPLVVFATPTIAQALPTEQGPWVGAKFEVDPGWTTQSADCQASFSFRRDSLGQQLLRVTAGFCRAGVDTSPWSCQTFEPNCTAYVFTFEGANCAAVTLDPATRSVAEDSFTAIFSGWVADEALAGTCDPTSACIEVFYDGVGNDSSTLECVSIELDPLAPFSGSTSSCATATMDQPRLETAPVNKAAAWDASAWYWFQTVQFGVSGVSGQEAYTGYIVYGPDVANSPGSDLTGESLGMQLTLDYFAVPAGNAPSQEVLLQAGFASATGPGVPAAPYTAIKGMGYIRNSVAESGGNPNSLNPLAVKLPQADATNGLIGVTDPLRCATYWGLKVASIAANTKDEPIAALAAPPAAVTDGPAVNPGTPEADDSTPTTETGFWQAILGILRQIWAGIQEVVEAIAGLGEAIVAGILGGFSSAFVPDDAVIDGEVDSLRDAWEGTSLTKYKDAVTGQSFAAPGSGCEGVPVTLPIPQMGDVSMDIGAACSGSMATSAGIVKMVLSAGIIIFGGLACVRGIGSGFGWNPGIGKGAES